MTNFYTLIRHTPFWAVPMLVICIEFAYVFWLRKKKTNLKICLVFAFISIVALSWYYYAGGPDKAVRKLIKWQRSQE